MLEIGVLGPLFIRQSNNSALAFESLKARALLVYLSVESDRPHSRETLACMFWPDRPDTAALANLRHTLASLRTTLGERGQEQDGEKETCFSVTSNSLQFNFSVNALMDLGAFEKYLQSADSTPEEDANTRIEFLKAAVGLYRGSFLEGFSLKGCPEFEDWMLLRRENISLKLQKALRSLSDVQLKTGDWENALAALRQLLQIDPWNEAVHRKVMLILAEQDQRSAALSQYERCRKLLLDELGVNPEEETVHLYEKIRAGTLISSPAKEKSARPLPGDNGGSRADKPARNAFVGRRPELAHLQKSLKLTLAEQGQLIFITGEAGSGKTSLAWEFAHQAMSQQSDLLISSGRCSAVTGFEDPYLPFREILQMLVSGPDLLPGRTLPIDHRRRLSEAFPEIIKSLLESGPDLIDSFIQKDALLQRIDTFRPGRNDWRQKVKQEVASLSARSHPAVSSVFVRRPNEAMASMLFDLSRHRPLLLLIDDLQWADAGSISLLHYMARRLPSSRVMVLGAYRPQDMVRSSLESPMGKERHPLERVQLELQREYGDIVINLDDPGGTDFINALVDREPNCLGESFRQMLYHVTDGNPLFTVELLHTMQDRGNLTRDPFGRWVEGEPFNLEKLPARIEAVIAERIGRLPHNEQRLLRAASVEGEIFTAQVVAKVLGLEEDQVVNCLSGSLSQEQQIVSSLGTSRTELEACSPLARLSRYRFRHFLFQKYIYNRLDPVQRSALHEATGIAMESLFGKNDHGIALQLAWHFEQGNLIERAVEYLLIAGKTAAQLSSYVEAKAIYDRCLEMLKKLPESTDRARLEIRVQLARQVPLLATNGWGNQETAQAANRAIELIERFDGKNLDSSILLALYFQADYFNAHNNMPEALTRVKLLLAQFNSQTGRMYQTLIYSIAGQVYLFSGQLVTGADYLEKSIASFNLEDQDKLVELIGHNILSASMTWGAWAQWLLGNLDRSQELRQKAIDHARKQSNQFYAVMTIALTGALFSAVMNDPEQAVEFSQECLRRINPREEHHIGRILSEAVLGWAKVKQGEAEKGIALIKKAVIQWKSEGAFTLQPVSYILLADALSLADHTQPALEAIEAAAEMVGRTGRWVLGAQIAWLHGEILYRESCRAGSALPADQNLVEYFERAMELAQEQQARAIELRAAASLARILKEQGRAAEGAGRLEKVLHQYTEGSDNVDLRAARELLEELSISC